MSINHMTYAALNEVAQERARQIEVEGFDAVHDDGHKDRSLALAGAAYADAASWDNDKRLWRVGVAPVKPPSWWPWFEQWWKPTTRRRDLIKAAALIVAEIERLDRIVALGGDPDA